MSNRILYNYKIITKFIFVMAMLWSLNSLKAQPIQDLSQSTLNHQPHNTLNRKFDAKFFMELLQNRAFILHDRLIGFITHAHLPESLKASIIKKNLLHRECRPAIGRLNRYGNILIENDVLPVMVENLLTEIIDCNQKTRTHTTPDLEYYALESLIRNVRDPFAKQRLTARLIMSMPSSTIRDDLLGEWLLNYSDLPQSHPYVKETMVKLIDSLIAKNENAKAMDYISIFHKHPISTEVCIRKRYLENMQGIPATTVCDLSTIDFTETSLKLLAHQISKADLDVKVKKLLSFIDKESERRLAEIIQLPLSSNQVFSLVKLSSLPSKIQKRWSDINESQNRMVAILRTYNQLPTLSEAENLSPQIQKLERRLLQQASHSVLMQMRAAIQDMEILKIYIDINHMQRLLAYIKLKKKTLGLQKKLSRMTYANSTRRSSLATDRLKSNLDKIHKIEIDFFVKDYNQIYSSLAQSIIKRKSDRIAKILIDHAGLEMAR